MYNADLNTMAADKGTVKSDNFTLKHSVVFSGKEYEDHRLVAADALVVTLIHLLNSPVGREWERKAEALARQKPSNFRIYPQDGSIGSTLYEFRSQPLTISDKLVLTSTYSLTTLYILSNSSKLPALKSKIGLILALLGQIGVSVISSLTICAILQIDLYQLPRDIFPIIILVIGLENGFRIVLAVSMTPPQASTACRIGDALGRTGHVALASLIQNLVILWMLSQVVSPGVAAFCIFVAIALIFDFFYLMTFSFAVLSINLRGIELRDSLSRSCSRRPWPWMPDDCPRETWIKSIIHGGGNIPGRVAGTFVMVFCIIAAECHFFNREGIFQVLFRLLRQAQSTRPGRHQMPLPMLAIDINKARGLAGWCQLANHEIAREVVQVLRPDACSYVVRVYDPLIFVLDGSDRTSYHVSAGPFLPAFYDFTRHQKAPLVFTVPFLVAAVSLSMNYWLGDGTREAGDGEQLGDQPLISVKSLYGHVLDIVLLSTSIGGTIASVGLDRCIRVWDVRHGEGSCEVPTPQLDNDPFPVLAMAIDSGSKWLAILSAKGFVALWNIPERRWGPTVPVLRKGKTPAALIFGNSPTELIGQVFLIWLTD